VHSACVLLRTTAGNGDLESQVILGEIAEYENLPLSEKEAEFWKNRVNDNILKLSKSANLDDKYILSGYYREGRNTWPDGLLCPAKSAFPETAGGSRESGPGCSDNRHVPRVLRASAGSPIMAQARWEEANSEHP